MTPIDKMMDAIEWSETSAQPGTDGIPYATHSGVLEVAGLRLRCYRLNDGRAIFDADDFKAAFPGLLGTEAA
jgi:hypothetical protein